MDAALHNTRPAFCGEAIKNKINVCPMELQSLKMWSLSLATFYSLVWCEMKSLFCGGMLWIHSLIAYVVVLYKKLFSTFMGSTEKNLLIYIKL